MKKLVDEELEKLICDFPGSKYKATVLVMHWARHLKRLEENQNLTMTDIIEKAMKDIICGKVKPEEVLKTASQENNALEAAALRRKAEKNKK